MRINRISVYIFSVLMKLCYTLSLLYSATGTAILLEHEQKQVNQIVGSVSLGCVSI